MKWTIGILLTFAVIITAAYALYGFVLVPVLVYGFITFACISHDKGVRHSLMSFVEAHRTAYCLCSVLLVFLAGVNYAKNLSEVSYYNAAYASVANDTVVSIKPWGKMGNEIRLSDGQRFKIYLTEKQYLYLLAEKHNLILHKEADSDTMTFTTLSGFESIHRFNNPRLEPVLP